MSTFAPLQFLKSAQNPLVWTAVDNGTDTRTSLIIYYGAANTLPADTDMYEVNCIMMHQAEKQLYANTGTAATPTWEAFGPNSAFPQPLVPGSFLFTDGATVYWATQLVGQIQYNASNLNQYGILNFNNLLVASNDVPNSRINVDLDVVSLAGDATFISTLEGNLSLQNIGGLLDWTQIDQSSVSVDLATQVTGVLNSTNIDITNLESNLDLSQIAGSLDLTTQVTGLLPPANIDVTALAGDATFLATLIPNLDENVKVAVDGVTITGDGTTGNPLVATGSGSGSSKLVQDMTSFTSSGTGLQTAYTEVIPAGTLGPNNSIRVTLLRARGSGGGSAPVFDVYVKYGGQTVAQLVFDAGAFSGNNKWFSVSSTISADGAVNQASTTIGTFTQNPPAGDSQVITVGELTTVDSTVNQNLVIDVQPSVGTVDIEGILIEKIS